MGTTSSSCMSACGDCKQTKVELLGDPLDEALAKGVTPTRYEHSEAIANLGGGATASNVPPTTGSAVRDWPQTNSAEDYGDEFDDAEYQEQSPEQAAQAQKVIADFTRKMVKGRSVLVLATTGSTIECIASLDRKLHFLSIQRAGKKDAKKRSIPLEEIEKVSVGTDLASESGLPLDEFCVCFMLKEGQAIAFRIEDIEERDTFALILSMFVDQRTQEVERKKLKEAQKKK